MQRVLCGLRKTGVANKVRILSVEWQEPMTDLGDMCYLRLRSLPQCVVTVNIIAFAEISQLTIELLAAWNYKLSSRTNVLDAKVNSCSPYSYSLVHCRHQYKGYRHTVILDLLMALSRLDRDMHSSMVHSYYIDSSAYDDAFYTFGNDMY